MASLGEKITAEKALVAILGNITDVVSEEDAEKLNAQFGVFGKKLVPPKDKDGVYDLQEAKDLYATCLAVVKKEYSAKLFGCIAIQMMFEE